MTILGQHTVSETRALGKAIDFQFSRVDSAFQRIPESYKTGNAEAYGQLVFNWTKAKDDWRKDWNLSQALLSAASGYGVGAADDVVPVESVWTRVRSHTAGGGRNGPDSLYSVKAKVEEITGKPVDLSGQPSQLDVSDVDLNLKHKTDDIIDKGEEAAKKAAKSNTVLYIGLGALGALGLVAASKVYL